ncbi:MAG: glutaredoxin family protein [Candidatus Aenigmatarchaeota archaeon]
MAKEKRVRIFSTTSCPWCVRAKEWLKENKIEFEEVDVQQDRAAAQEMVEKSGQTGVPVLEVGDKIIVGFNLEELKKALGME